MDFSALSAEVIGSTNIIGNIINDYWYILESKM